MPSTADAMPATRNDVSGLSSALAASAFRGAGKRREKQSLDDKHETDRNEELGHFA